MNQSPASPAPVNRRMLQGALLLAAMTSFAYLPALRAGFIWDDDDYVTNNPTLQSVDGLRRIWFEFGATRQYYPLVYTSFWIEHRLYGVAPAGYHAVNLALHVLASILLWRLLCRLRVPAAFFAAAIFAVHPVHVESVAWITERKNVLSMVFYLAALLAYLRYDPLAPSQNSLADVSHSTVPARRCLPFTLVLYLGALLSKSVTCSLPAAILLLVWWKRGRLTRRDGISTLPMFALGIVFAAITAWMERAHVGAGDPQWQRSFAERLINAGWASWSYVGKLLWPHPLIFIYPKWFPDTSNPLHYLPVVALLFVAVALWRFRDQLGRGPLVAWLFFLGTLLPALGFINIYYAIRYAPVADHFVYHASLSFIVLFAAVMACLARRLTASTRVPTLAASLLLAVLSFLTWRQAGIYRDEETLWRDTLAKNDKAALAHLNLGAILQRRGDDDGAIHHYQRTLDVDIPDARTHFNLGTVLQRKGRVDEAISHYRRALELQPDYPKCLVNLGIALMSTDIAVAETCLQKAVALQPDYALAHAHHAQALERLGRRDEARKSYETALRLNPRDNQSREGLRRLTGP